MKAKIGIIGGTGFYHFLKGKEVLVNTPYGKPSDKILISRVFGKEIAFLPRHGKKHSFPPHKINYLANIFAFKKLGVERIIAPCAVGSLKAKFKPGDFALADQFIDRTKARKDTFFEGLTVAHISMADPYCQELREIALRSFKKLKIPVHSRATVVVIEGPRFSTKAESKNYSQMADLINMTQYPEVVLAKEMGICYLNISLITDYDAGLKGRKDIKPVSASEVIRVFNENTEKFKKMILKIIEDLPEKRKCSCAQAISEAIVSH